MPRRSRRAPACRCPSSAAGHNYQGFINAANQLEWVHTWIDSPVLGDTQVETKFSGYKDFGGVQFPPH